MPSLKKMISNSTKKILRKSLTFFLVLVMTVTTFYFPSARLTPKAEAFGLPVVDIPKWIMDGLDIIGRAIAQRMVDDIVQSSIKWANSGFDGNPTFWTNPGKELGKIASASVGDYIDGNKRLSFLCSPFQAQIKLSIRDAYINPIPTQCTLEQIGVNVQKFYGSFNEGGWDAWIKMTQDDQNNPYGAFITIKADVDQQMANAIGLKKDELAQGRGFLNFKDCEAWNVYPLPDVVKEYNNGNALKKAQIQDQYPEWNPNKDPGECLTPGAIRTPGAVIEKQLNESLPSGLKNLISAEHIDALASAFLSGALKRYVFSKKGLVSDSSTKAKTQEVIDVDGDGIPDGYDEDDDGQLDICHHGLANPDNPPSNTNCLLSSKVTSSPYFIPICSITSKTTTALESYMTFLKANPKWDPQAYLTWQNRTIRIKSAMDDFSNTLLQYESPVFDKVVSGIGSYLNHYDVMVESLVKDKDMRNDGLPGSDDRQGRGNADTYTITVTTQYTQHLIDYVNQFKSRIKQCNNPDLNAISNIPLPPPVDGTSTSDNSNPTTTGANFLSCTPTTSNSTVGTNIFWRVTNTYPSGTEYRWIGTNINSASTTNITDLSIIYDYAGPKQAAVGIVPAGGTYTVAQCSPDVFVTDRNGAQ